jgi:hypothetical protein
MSIPVSSRRLPFWGKLADDFGLAWKESGMCVKARATWSSLSRLTQVMTGAKENGG